MLAADALVLYSHADPAPLIISEAREAGLAVIGARVDGLPELLDDGAAGVLVEPRNPAALADAILQVVQDEMSLAHFRLLSQINIGHLSLGRVAAQTVALYGEILRPGVADRFSGGVSSAPSIDRRVL